MSMTTVSSNPVRAIPTGGIFADLEALRIGTSTASAVTSAEVLTHVPVRRGKKQEYFRINPDPSTQLLTNTYEDKEDREIYLVAPEMWPYMVGDMTATQLHTAVSRQGVVSIFPLKIPTEGESASPWHDTARQAVELAKESWVRLSADMALGAYRIHKAEGELGEPKWPEKSFGELLEVAFKGKVIDHESHPVIQRLRGRI